MSSRDDEVALPPEAVAAAEELRKWDGVVGVFWGDRYKESEGRWIAERTLCVHVQKKRLESELTASTLIPSTIDGFRTDVLEVGRIVAHSVGVPNLVETGGPLSRSSTITALARIDGVPHALLSGHGTLPYDRARRQIRTSYLYSGANDLYHGSADLDLSSTSVEISIGNVRGQLLFGKLGERGSVDFALAKLETNSVDYGHPAVRDSAALPVTSPPSEHEGVKHWSSLKNIMREGTRHGTAATDIEVYLPDGQKQLYTNAYMVSGNGGKDFSRLGDSGSAVATTNEPNNQIVGTVLGGSTIKPISYFLRIRALHRYLGDRVYDRFFSET